MIKWLVTLILLLTTSACFAELGPVWNKAYGSANYDEGTSLLQLSDGGYIVAGTVNSAAQDLYIVRTDANGDSLWTLTENLNGIDKVFAITETADGGFALTGTTSGPGQGFEAFIYRLDANGDSLWFRYYGGPLTENGRDIIELPDGSLVMGGNTYSFGEGTGDFWLLKVSSSGDSLWSQTYGGVSQDELRAIDLAPDGGFILGGSNESVGAGGADLWLVKTDSQGNQEWATLFGGDGLDWGYDALTTSDNNYLIIGRTLSFGFNDYYAVKVDPNGNEIWSESYNGGSVEWPFAVTETDDGGFAICGSSNFGGGAGGDDVWVLQIDAMGEIVDSGLAGGTMDDVAYDIIQNSDGDFVFTGKTNSFGAGDSDLWLVKMAFGALNNSPEDFFRLTPLDGSTTSAYSIEFSWEEAEDVDLDTVVYSFNVWTPTFTTPEPAAVETTATSLTILIPDPPHGTEPGMHDYFWTVTATDGVDTIEALNGQGLFTFNYVGPNLPPNDFTRVYPADDSVVVSHNLILSWTPAVDPNGDVVDYTFTIDSPTYIDAVPSNVVTQDTFVAVVIPANGPTGLHDFNWTVEATDGEFTVDPTNGDGQFQFLEDDPPIAFERVSPEDGTLFTENEITLTWSRSTDPEEGQIDYIVNISTETFETPIPSMMVFQDTFLTITIPDPEPGTPGGTHTYTWTVEASDGWNTIPASNGEGFFFYNYMMPNEPPGSFSRIYPLHDELIDENEITLRWSSSIDPDGDSITYMMNLMSETFPAPVPSSIITGDTFAVINIPDPLEGTLSGIHEYLWTLYASDGIETVTADSGASIFRYQYIAPNESPGDFTRVSPEDDTVISENEITLAWTPAVDPNGDIVEYNVSIGSATFVTPVPDGATTQDTFLVVTIPDPAPDTPSGIHEYVWTIVATDGEFAVNPTNGNGNFQYEYIAPNRPPGEFTRLTPADSSVDEFDGFCRWSESIDPDGDDIEYIFHIESDWDLVSPTDTVVADTFVNVIVEVPTTPLDERFWFNWSVHATDGEDTVEAANGEGVFGLDIVLASGEQNSVVDEFGLNVYPNPFNPSTTIHYSIDQAGPVSITVSDILGRQVAELVNATMNPGSYTMNWTARGANGLALPSGSYWVRLTLNQSTEVHRIILMR